ISDGVDGGGGGPVQSFLHLHPRWELTPHADGFVATDAEGHTVRIELRGMERAEVVRGAMDPVQGWYLPAMGEAHPAPVIVATASRAASGFGFTLHDWTRA